MSGRAAPGSDAFRERRYTAQDGLTLYFREYGDPLAQGTPVLCLPGLARSSKDYHDVAMRLAKRRRVICPDYRGRGRSDYDTDWRNYRPETYVNDLRHLLATLNLHGIVVIGTSFGAFLAMGLAVLVPSVLRGAVLNDAGPDVSPVGLQRIIAYVGAEHPQPDWPAAVAFLQRIMPNLPFETEDEWMQLARNTFREAEDGRLRYDWDVDIVKPMARSKEPLPDLWGLFRALRDLPVLAFRGEHSDVLAADTLERMAEALPDIRCITIPKAGHTPTLSEPVAAEALDAFLADLD